jgi:hypothetical protein
LKMHSFLWVRHWRVGIVNDGGIRGQGWKWFKTVARISVRDRGLIRNTALLFHPLDVPFGPVTNFLLRKRRRNRRSYRWNNGGSWGGDWE